MKTGIRKRYLAGLLAFLLMFCQPGLLSVRADQVAAQLQTVQLVLTLGADLSPDQKSYILQYFGISEDQAKVLTITNADERSQLSGLVAEEVIGTHTYSCALVRPTSSGGIQVKTANTNYVTSNMIAMNLSSSGVYNCEVLVAAPFEVSGTGALTGIMMAYEAASGETLDPEKKQLANEEMVITGEIAETVGQEQATLVVNDIKIHIIRDQITDQQGVNAVVDEVIATTGQAASEAATMQGQAAPATLGEVHKEKLYDYGYKVSQMGYRYKDMQPTLERITRNVTKSTGIDDPITDTFTTTDEDSVLDPNSILLSTDDEVMGEEANINATSSVAMGDHPAEPIDVVTGDVILTESGGVKAESFIRGTDIVAYKDVNGSYALMDLNGNMLTDALYSEYLQGRYGHIEAAQNDGTGKRGVLASDGMTEVPFQYDEVEVLNELWATGVLLKEGTEEDHDYYSSSNYYQIASMDVYYLGGDSAAPVATLAREQIGSIWASGAYLLIEDRAGVVTAYDAAFTPMADAYDRYDEDEALAEQLSDALGFSVYKFYGNYAKIHDYNTGKFGVVDRYGNIIVPMEFDDVVYWDNYLMAGGYFGVSVGGQFAYVTAGGTVTGSYGYPADSVQNYGMAARYEAEDGSVTLLSGDGVESSLGTTYESVYAVDSSKGMLWNCYKEGGYDLLDWHGNVLISGSDNYSVAANGNYVIAQNGYTSSTLYLVNDASPVALSESAGGAVELEAEIVEGASMELYTGDPTVELIGDIHGTDFVDGTHLVKASEDGEKYALMTTDGTQLTEPVYMDFIYEHGWIRTAQNVNSAALQGLISTEGMELIPCLYNELKVLNENWAIGYILTGGATEENYDFHDYSGNYYFIDEATVYHISDEELTSVTLTRDQIADIDAEEDYLNIQDRTTGAVTTYDATFTAVAAASTIYSFDGLSKKDALARKLRDSTGYSIYDEEFADGYTAIADYSQEEPVCGVMDMSGNIILPVEYDRILTYYSDGSHQWANGYFAVEKDGMAGFVTKDGQVTCELKYPADIFMNQGMAGKYQNSDGTYTLVAADGVETTGFVNSLSSNGNGLLWETSDSNYKSLLLDWHGNVLFEDFERANATTDGKFIIVQQDYDSVPQLYAVDGAAVETAAPQAPAAQEKASENEAADPNAQAAGTESQPESQLPETAASSEQTAQPESQTPETAAATEQTAESGTPAPETGAQTDQGSAGALLSSASQLLTADLEANRDSIVTLLQQAKTMLDSTNPEAATLINSAVTLLQSGATDAASVSTLIATAQGML